MATTTASPERDDLNEQLRAWVGNETDLDSVIWAAAQDEEIETLLVAAIREARIDYHHEMFETHGCRHCSRASNRPEGAAVLGWTCPHCESYC